MYVLIGKEQERDTERNRKSEQTRKRDKKKNVRETENLSLSLIHLLDCGGVRDLRSRLSEFN